MKPKHLIFIFRTAPYENALSKEGLDALLAASIYEQKISVLFLADGVFQLKKGQQPNKVKSQEKMLSALPMYDINEVYAHEDALHDRSILIEDCCIKVNSINTSNVAQLLHSADHILSF